MDAKILVANILPVACCFAVGLIFSNEAYIYLSVSYIQMLKAFTPVAVLLMSVLGGLAKSSIMELSIVGVICVGVALTSLGELRFSFIGFIFQAIGILAETARLVLTDLLMSEVKLDPLSSLYYIAPCSALGLGLCCLYFEAGTLPWGRILTNAFLSLLLLNGMIAFTLNVAVVMLIKNTSALVLTLSGVIKDILLVCLSVSLFDAPVTPLQYFGYGIALIGLNLHKEFKKSPENITAILVQIGLRSGAPAPAVADSVDPEEGVALVTAEK